MKSILYGVVFTLALSSAGASAQLLVNEQQLMVLTKLQPAPGLMVLALYDFEKYQRAHPGIETRWQPADGRIAPADSLYARMRRKSAGHDPDDTSVDVRLPDMRGLFIAGERSVGGVTEDHQSMTRDGEVMARPMTRGRVEISETKEDRAPVTPIYVYVRVN